MNNGAFGENFPYSNFHDLNMDWIVKIAKDFLDQYTHIQDVIDTGLNDLDEKATTLQNLLQEWYDTHSEDIANQLADALEDLNTWYTTHQNYLDQKLADNLASFNQQAEQKARETIASIPDNYTDLANKVTNNRIDFDNKCAESNTNYYTVNVNPGWNEDYFFSSYHMGAHETRIFIVDFEEAPEGSTYITLANNHDDIKYQTQYRNIKTRTFTFDSGNTEYQNLALWVSTDTYNKKVSVTMINPFMVGSSESIKDRLNCIAKENTGYYSLARLGYFGHGSYEYPNTAYFTYMVASLSPIHTDNDLYIKIKPGYQARVYTIVSGTGSGTGWQPNSIYIPANSDFVITIQRATPDTSETVDIAEMVNAMIILDQYITPWNDGKYYADYWQSGKSVRWDTGAIESVSGYWELYTFKNPKFSKIRVFGSIHGRSNAEIAMYSTEEPTTDGYIQSASAQPGSWDQIHWTEATVPENCKCVCVCSRNVDNNNNPHNIGIYINDIENYTLKLESERNPGLNLMTNTDFRYIYHFNANHLGQSEIPAQSIYDIEMAHRLGFKCYELNVHPTATSGKYVCMHGTSGKIGNELIARNGTDISQIDINSVTYDTFLNNYIYNTTNSKYASHVTFLDEALTLCKKYNMIPYLTWANYEMIEYVKAIYGNGFVLNVYNEYYIRRALFKGTYSIYKTLSDEDLKTLIDTIHAPFIYSLTVDHLSMSDDEIREQVKICHDNNCIVSFAEVYQTQAQNMRFYDLGADISSSGWSVEYFNDGNLMSLHDEGNFSEFYHGGTVSDGILRLSTGEYLSSQYSETAPEISKGFLTIRFKGTITIDIGENISQLQLTSDGNRYFTLSTAFFKYRPNFTVQAQATTEIYNCIYDASIC